MKPGWEIKKLGDVCRLLTDGDWIESKDQSSNGIRLIQTGNIGEGTFKNKFDKSRYISLETFKKLKCTEIFSGDCLISRLPDPVGRSCILPIISERMITAVDCAIVRFDFNKIIPQWFIFYSMSKNYQDMINDKLSGTTRQRISRGNLSSIIIPLPSPDEQKRIVEILDSVFLEIKRAKEIAEQNLHNAREVFDSTLNSIFTNKGKDWEVKRLKDIGTTQTGTTPATSNKEYYGGNIPFIKPADINIYENGTINYENDSLTAIGGEVGRLIEANSILMVCIGTLGKVGFADRVVSCNQQINTLTPDKNLCAKLFYYAMKIESFHEKVVMDSSQTTLPIINKTKWENLTISYPSSISEQQFIVQKLNALSAEVKRLESIYQQKLNDLEELKKAILKKAFDGEL